MYFIRTTRYSTNTPPQTVLFASHRTTMEGALNQLEEFNANTGGSRYNLECIQKLEANVTPATLMNLGVKVFREEKS